MSLTANEIVPVTAEMFQRVLCGECPATAEVLHVERMEELDSMLAVVRCHGETFFLEVGGRLVRRRSTLLLEDLLPGRLTTKDVLKFIDEREQHAERLLRAAAYFRDALGKSGAALAGDGVKRERYTVLAELMMNHAEMYK